MLLLSETRGRVRLLTLNRPDKRNALSLPLCAALLAALRAADAEDGVAAVVIAGAGAGFSAGGDLDERRALGADATAWAARGAVVDDMLAAPGAMGKPVVAAVHGRMVGMGASLALCCDLAVAAGDLRITWPEARHDIYPTLVAPMLLRHVGPKDAFELLATGRPVEAAEALALRLVNRIVPRDGLVEAACRMAEDAAQYGPAAMRGMKAWINAAGTRP